LARPSTAFGNNSRRAAGNLIKVSYPNGTETDYDYTSYWTTLA
jgi:hypothetical protein